MDKRRLIIGLIAILAIPIYIWIAYVEIPGKAKVGEEKLQQSPLSHDFANSLPFESDYMGDASNMGNLFQSLPLSEYKTGIELDPYHYSAVIHYNTTWNEESKKVFLYNSTAAFVLIHNLGTVHLDFSDRTVSASREDVEKWYGDTWQELKTADGFAKHVQKPLKQDDIDEWLFTFTEGEQD